MNSHILLVEDEPGLILTLRDLLESEGFTVDTASDGDYGFSLALNGGYDLLLLDLMLPGRSGLDICRELRRAGNLIPVLILTAKSQTSDRIHGLKSGADDYLGKPFDPEELLARIEAILRRTLHQAPRARQIQFGDIAIDFERAELIRNGSAIGLAAKEWQLLAYLVSHPDEIVTREELLREVWNYNSDVSSRTLDVHVAWLRQKLEDNPQQPRYILTVRGRGYRFAP